MGMIIATALTFVGLFFVYLEFFVPGAILGTLGGILLVSSIGVAFWQAETFFLGLGYLCIVIVLLVATVRLALWKIKRSSGKNTFYAISSQEGYQASTFDRQLIGKKGTAVTDLKPAGRVIIEEQWHQAVSEGSYVRKGETIVVLRGEGARLIVRKEIKK